MSITVPRRGDGYVPTAPIPGVRGNPNAPASAFGDPDPIPIGPALKQAQDILLHEQQKADEVSVMAADNQLSDLSIGLQSEALKRQGKDALSALPETQDQWTQKTAEIENGLTNDRQKLTFKRTAQARWEHLHAFIAEHTDTELRKFDDETTIANLKNRFNDAVTGYKDPAAVAQAIGESRVLVAQKGAREGWSPDKVSERTRDAVSQIHAGVVERMLATGQDLSATDYYRKNQEQIQADDATHIEKQLEVGSLRGESQRQADAIVATAATMSAALAQARAIADPQVRDATREQVIHYYEDQATSSRLEREQTFQRAGQILEKTADVRSIPPADWLKLSVEERDHLQYREDQMRRPKRVTNPDTFYSLLNMSGLSDASRKEFESLDLMKYRPQLSDADFEDLAKLQRTSRLRTEGGVASEARRQSTAVQKVADKAAARAAAIEQLRGLGLNIPDAQVPGAPLRPQAQSPSVGTPSRNAPAGATRSSSQQKVPQAWLDRAAHDPNYKIYLQHMGIDVP